MNWKDLTKEEQQKIYDTTMHDISNCCDCWEYPIEDVDGICKECGSATSGGEAICGCSYSPTDCKVCNSSPCDGSC